MYHVVITIQFISIFVIFVESWVVFRHWKNALHSYLFLSCAATLINNIGYLLELLSDSEDKYFTATQFSYLGRVWIPLALFLFIAELVQVKVPQIVKGILAFLHIFTYGAMVTTKTTGLYYKQMSFSMLGPFPYFEHKNGIIHDIWNAELVILIIIGMGMLFRKVLTERHKATKWRLYTVICAILAESIALIIEITHLFPITAIYDVTMLGFTVGAVFMSISIFRYNLLDPKNLAREYVVDELSEGIIAVNENGDISYYNKPAKQLFPDIDENSQKVIDILCNSISTGKPIRIDERIYEPTKNVLSKEGDVAGIIYAIKDYTEHYRYIEELSEQKQIADEANKAKSSFLANMSHEIRTPINAVLGMDEMILREAKDKSILSYAEDIRAAGRTLLSIINDILDFSKIEEGRMEIIPAQYELASVIIDLMNMVRERALKKKLELNLNIDDSIPHLLYGDELRIRQIILNLMTNAIKYTEKGSVKLDISYFKYRENEIMLCVKVSDTGIGMKKEDLEKLFSPFIRFDEKRNRSIEGTGLGMSIVKQLLALMNSNLEVQSVYGEGSQFSFEIKQKVISWDPMGDVIARFESELQKRENYHELFHAPDASVLVVDDTEVNLTVISNLLKNTKIHIDTVTSGFDALRLLDDKSYDIAFIDHMMPNMDGIETLNKIKEQNPSIDTIFIALTANAISGAREMYLKSGFTDYMSKPVEGRVLEEMVKKYLPSEKIIYVSEDCCLEDAEAEDGYEEQNENEIPKWLKDIEEIDIQKGIENNGSPAGFLSVLKVFHQTAAMKADEIENLYMIGDLENYTIKVHGLKSSARIIGATALSDMAKELEAAGTARDMDKIDEGTTPLLNMFRAVDEKISRIAGDKKELKDLSDSMREDAFQTMMEAAQEEDYGLMENLISELKEYKLDDNDAQTLKQLETLLMDLDWDGINELVSEVCKDLF